MMQTAPLFDLPSAHALGYQPMDDIHGEFLELVQALTDAQDLGVADALGAVARHAREHFSSEEAWMRDTGFPATQCHADEHAAVLASIEGVQRRVRVGELAPARALARALTEWFPAHADYMDAALAHWMCKLRLGGKPVVLHRALASSRVIAKQ